MDWFNAERKTPLPFESVLCYVPSEKPYPTVHEGYINEEGEWSVYRLNQYVGKVTYWTYMPEFPE